MSAFSPAEPQFLPLTPEVPTEGAVATYTRFGSAFEAHEFTDWVDESMSWKETCYIGDWSPLAKIRVKGPDALRFFSDISINSFAKFVIGQAKHAVFCNASGKVMGEGVLMKLDEDEYLFTSGPGVPWAVFQFQKGGYDATLTDVKDVQTIVQVQGPNALFVLEKATGESLRDIGFMRFRETAIGDARFLLLRQGMSGSLGYEIHGNAADGVAVYDAILSAGQEFGIRRLGGRTKMVNHVEACFPTPTVDYMPAYSDPSVADFVEWFQQAGGAMIKFFLRATGSLEAELSDLERSPVELGWGKSIKFDHDFIGSEALKAELADPKRKICTLVWDSEDVIDVYASLFRPGPAHEPMELPRNLLGQLWADKVLKDGVLVGSAMSRCYSYHFREMLSLAILDIEYTEPGTRVEVIWGRPGQTQKTVRATVHPAPYKKDDRKIDVHALPSYL